MYSPRKAQIQQKVAALRADIEANRARRDPFAQKVAAARAKVQAERKNRQQRYAELRKQQRTLMHHSYGNHNCNRNRNPHTLGNQP